MGNFNDPKSLLDALRVLEGRNLLAVVRFTDDYDGERIDLYFDGQPHMAVRLRADCGAYHGVEIEPIREMGPNYAMGSPTRPKPRPPVDGGLD